jgi:peptide/nickel transport system substrate-binding protein
MRARPAAAARPAVQDETPKPGGTLTALIVDDPNFLDILVTQLAQCRQTLSSIYETLTVQDAADGVTKGRLARDWVFTEPTKLDMNLQEGVTFHEGQDFTAEDVKWTVEYVKNPDTGSPNASIIDQIDTVEVLEPLKVRFNLKAPWPALLDDLTTIQIYSRTATADSIATKPNGTGPFTWTEWIPGDHITITKNANYWQPGLPYLDEIIFRPVTEQATRSAIMEAGDADLHFTPELREKARIDQNQNLAAVPSVLNDAGYILYVNNNRPPMSNQQVRLAASYALDRNAYFQSPTLAGQGTKNTSPWAASHWAYNPINDSAFEYDLEMAAQLLAEGGYPEGVAADGSRLSINLVYPAGYPEWLDGSTLFQAAMDDLGVDVKVEELELATWIDRIVNTDQYDLSWDVHFQRAVDPAWTLSLAFFYPPGPQNICRYEDATMTELISAGGSELDQEKRAEHYFAFQERWNEIMPGLIVGEYLLYHVTQSYVKGFHTHPLFFQDFSTVWLDK